MAPDLAVVNAGELVSCHGAGSAPVEQLGIIEDGAMVVNDGKVAWIGTSKQLKRKSYGKPRATVDARGSLVTPGFVDPHTHLVFAGSREDELERKTGGESYTSILKSGGGILRTVKETREASIVEILGQSLGRLTQLLRNGVTTVEVKTGYGQSLVSELKILETIGRLKGSSPVDVVPTFLGLHAKPPEYRSAAEYVSFAIREMLPAVIRSKYRPAFSDCFCEEGVFSRQECARYLRASRELGFGLKIHADEFSDSGGASLGAEMGCVSADHLGQANRTGVQAMAGKGVTAVLLPGTSLFSGIPYADARSIKEAGCDLALGTDLSPNSWIESPQLVMSIACNSMRISPAEALLGFTRNAAKAISRRDVGSLRVGASADFVVHAMPNYRFLAYRVGGGYVRTVFKAGRKVYSGPGG